MLKRFSIFLITLFIQVGCGLSNCFKLKKDPVNLYIYIDAGQKLHGDFTVFLDDCQDNYKTQLEFTDSRRTYLVDWYHDKVRITYVPGMIQPSSFELSVEY